MKKLTISYTQQEWLDDLPARITRTEKRIHGAWICLMLIGLIMLVL